MEQWRSDVTDRARAAAPANSSVKVDEGITAALLTETLVLVSGDLDRLSAAGRGVLNVVFGVEKVSAMAKQAHDDLVSRATELFAGEQKRFADLFVGPDLVRESQRDVRDAARKAESARHMDFLNGQITV